MGSSLTITKIFLCMLFRFCETFFRIFFNVSKVSVPLHCFFDFAKEWMLKKPKGLILHFSALCDLPETLKKFEKNLSENFFPHAGTVEESI